MLNLEYFVTCLLTYLFVRQQSAVTKRSPNAWQTAVALRDTAAQMLETEETLLIPLVAQTVDVSTQSRLNQRVLSTLGLWDSRLHLVAMHQAIQHNATEMELFQQEIPYLARSMIPRWKRTLYDPRVAALEEVINENETTTRP